jgi:hypothetical protein
MALKKLSKWKKPILRALRVAATVAFTIVLVTLIGIKIEMFRERHRAEQLMSDIHKIRLYQSNWTDAQALMYRWGDWGKSEQSCTAKDCRYSISLTNLPSLTGLPQWLLLNGGYRIYELLGGRYCNLVATFTVQDGVILRTTAHMIVDVPPRAWDWNGYGYQLIIATKSRQRLRRTKSDWWIMGSDEDLSEHPYYKVGRPGGCTSCEEAVVTYSTYTPAAEIERLSSFDFSCLTRFLACTTLEEVLPAATGWYLYRDDEEDAMKQKLKSLPPKPCDIPLWALGRDQAHVLVVDALSTSIERGWNGPYDVTNVRILEALKGDALWAAGTIVKASSFPGDFLNPPFKRAERLIPGHRYIILPVEDQTSKPESIGDDSRIEMGYCGTLDDTPHVRRELEKGYAQNDHLRGPER